MAYVNAGYVVCLSSLFAYGAALALRERRARRRGPPRGEGGGRVAEQASPR